MSDELVRRSEMEAALERRFSQFKRRVVLTVAACFAVGLGVSAGHAWAQASCTQTLPAPLVTLCPGGPARAVELNGNNAALLNWLTQKVGTQGTADVTTTGITSLRTTALNDQELRLRGTADATNRLAYTATGFAGTTYQGPVLAGTNGGALGTTTGTPRAVVAWNTAGATVTGGLTVNGTGGNVPHGCSQHSVTGPNVVACPTGEFAVSGGAGCEETGPVSFLAVFTPSGANDGWFALCRTTAGTLVNPAFVTAVCCKQ